MEVSDLSLFLKEQNINTKKLQLDKDYAADNSSDETWNTFHILCAVHLITAYGSKFLMNLTAADDSQT